MTWALYYIKDRNAARVPKTPVREELTRVPAREGPILDHRSRVAQDQKTRGIRSLVLRLFQRTSTALEGETSSC